MTASKLESIEQRLEEVEKLTTKTLVMAHKINLRLWQVSYPRSSQQGDAARIDSVQAALDRVLELVEDLGHEESS